jgi:hypothetical protein
MLMKHVAKVVQFKGLFSKYNTRVHYVTIQLDIRSPLDCANEDLHKV